MNAAKRKAGASYNFLIYLESVRNFILLLHVTGTLSSGIFCLFVGKPRFSANDSIVSRIGAFLVNLLVAGSQLFTVLFCLVGWGWSVWWGVIMFKMASKFIFRLNESYYKDSLGTCNMITFFQKKINEFC